MQRDTHKLAHIVYPRFPPPPKPARRALAHGQAFPWYRCEVGDRRTPVDVSSQYTIDPINGAYCFTIHTDACPVANPCCAMDIHKFELDAGEWLMPTACWNGACCGTRGVCPRPQVWGLLCRTFVCKLRAGCTLRAAGPPPRPDPCLPACLH